MMALYTGLNIRTPKEVRKAYEQTAQPELKEYRLKTFDKFVKSWKVRYFFNYGFKCDLAEICKILPGLGGLIDHSYGFIDADGNYFLLLQPYVNPEEFCKKNHIKKYVKYWLGGFHNEEASASTEKILQSYKHFQSVRGVAKDTGYSWNRIVKALSTSGIILNKSHARILELYKSGKTISQIAKETNLSKRTVQCYLPRTRPIYGENQSENAKRIVKHRTKKGNTNTNTIGF